MSSLKQKVSILDGHNSSICDILGSDRQPHGRIRTTDHENFPSMDGSGRSDEDGRLRTVHLSIRPCGRRTKILAQTVHLMDGFGRRTTKIFHRWTEADGGWRQIVHLMDGFRRRTTKNIRIMWTKVDGWTDG